jgi:hypothetical protein
MTLGTRGWWHGIHGSSMQCASICSGGYLIPYFTYINIRLCAYRDGKIGFFLKWDGKISWFLVACFVLYLYLVHPVMLLVSHGLKCMQLQN